MSAEGISSQVRTAGSATTAARDGDVKSTSYELFIAAITILSLVNLVLYFTPLDDGARSVIVALDSVIAVILLMDFSYRFITSKHRMRYLLREGGWADLLGSLPLVHLRIARLLRIVRLIQHHRRYGVRRAARSLVRDPAASTLAVVAFLGLVVIEAASLAIVSVEDGEPGANIITASDALWWSVVTVATVGYGDRFPVSNPGRLIGIALMLTGISLFSVFTGYLANRFVRPRDHTGESHLDAEIAEIRRLLAEQEAGRATLEAKLDRLTALAERDPTLTPAPSPVVTGEGSPQ